MTTSAPPPLRGPIDRARTLRLVASVGETARAIEAETRLQPIRVTRPHPLFVVVTREEHAVVVVPAAVWDRGRVLFRPFLPRIANGTLAVVLLGSPRDATEGQSVPPPPSSRNVSSSRAGGLPGALAGIVSPTPAREEIYVAVSRALDLVDARSRAESRGQWVDRYRSESGELVHIARAMTSERDVERLLEIILEKSRHVSGADAGSIYVLEGAEPNLVLRFKMTQNDSVPFDSREFTMPVSNRSIAGSAVLARAPINIADVYELPSGSPFGFDRRIDEKTGYRTKSMLVWPLISPRGDVIGVIQLINKKRDGARKKRLLTREDVDAFAIPFDDRSQELLGMVAAQAGASLENATLYDEIQKLFEGFVRASVEAIESRDPTTSGHSRRVADLTVTLARWVDAESIGPYREARFSGEDLRELEYASLLHDFGKIGVREKVLVKAKKLYDHELERIRTRFDFIARSIEADVRAREVEALSRGASKAEIRAMEEELAQRQAHLDAAYQSVLAANEPTVLSGGDFERITALTRETYRDLQGNLRSFLAEEEAESLSVKRGSLTASEFDEIRSHVSHTFRFLSQIPWGKSLRRVPQIAHAHHERLNGTGYPKRLLAAEIPLQSKLMAIADIFDALTASDRPYKKAVPIERALDILDLSVKDGHVDGDLVRIFRENETWTVLDRDGG